MSVGANVGAPEGWKRTGPATIERGAWCITKYLVQGTPRYALWRGAENCGYHATAQAAIESAAALDAPA